MGGPFSPWPEHLAGSSCQACGRCGPLGSRLCRLAGGQEGDCVGGPLWSGWAPRRGVLLAKLFLAAETFVLVHMGRRTSPRDLPCDARDDPVNSSGSCSRGPRSRGGVGGRRRFRPPHSWGHLCQMLVQGGRQGTGRCLPSRGVASLSSRASARGVRDGVEAADRWAWPGPGAQGPLGSAGRQPQIGLSLCPGRPRGLEGAVRA